MSSVSLMLQQCRSKSHFHDERQTSSVHRHVFPAFVRYQLSASSVNFAWDIANRDFCSTSTQKSQRAVLAFPELVVLNETPVTGKGLVVILIECSSDAGAALRINNLALIYGPQKI